MNKPLKRFTDRIGKTIYRDEVSCGCKTCEDGGKHGVEIFSEQHAQYLHTVQCEMGIKYRDTKEVDGLEKMKDLFGFK